MVGGLTGHGHIVCVDENQTSIDEFPEWFSEFFTDRQTRKPSVHTMKAYRQDFVAIAAFVPGGVPAGLAVSEIAKDSMRAAVAAFARDHKAAAVQRCWSPWNVLCTLPFH